MTTEPKSMAAMADEWRHNFWIERMRHVVTDFRAYAKTLRESAAKNPAGVAELADAAQALAYEDAATTLDDEITLAKEMP